MNEKETEENDVEIHVCLFARTKNSSSFEEGKETVAQQNNSTVDDLRKNHTFFVDDTVKNVGETYKEVENMINRYII